MIWETDQFEIILPTVRYASEPFAKVNKLDRQMVEGVLLSLT